MKYYCNARDDYDCVSIKCEDCSFKGNNDKGRKNDQDKLRMDLIPPEALEELAKVLTMGTQKYADRNWEKGIKWSRVLGAIFRHIIAWEMRGRVDPESGLSHLSHALCNLVFLVTYEQRHMEEFDDIHNKISG